MFTASLSPLWNRMDYLLDKDVEIELLSTMAFEDNFVTQQEKNEQHVDDTTTIPDSLPPNTEAATSSMEAVNPTEVAASPNEASRSHLLSLLEFKLPPLRFEATTPHPSAMGWHGSSSLNCVASPEEEATAMLNSLAMSLHRTQMERVKIIVTRHNLTTTLCEGNTPVGCTLNVKLGL